MSEEPRFPPEPQALDLSAKKLDTEESDDAKICLLYTSDAADE